MPGIGKFMEIESNLVGAGAWKVWGMTTKMYGISFWRDEHVPS